MIERLRAFVCGLSYTVAAEGLIVILGQLLAVSGAVASVKVLTKLLGPAQYGEFSLGFTISTLINQVVFAPLANGITRFYAPANAEREVGSLLRASCNLVLIATALIVGCALITWVSFGRTVTTSHAIFTVGLFLACTTSYNSILSAIQNAARQRLIVAVFQGIDPWIRLLLAALVTVFVGSSGKAVLLGYALAASLLFVLQAYVLFQRIVHLHGSSFLQTRLYFGRIWAFSWPFSVWSIFSLTQAGADRWCLLHFTDVTHVGLYTVAYQIGYFPMSILSALLVQLLAPILYHRAGDASDEERNMHVSRLAAIASIAVLVGCLGLFMVSFFVHRQVFGLLAGNQYLSASYILPWMVLAGGLFAVAQILSLDLMSRLRVSSMMNIKICTGIFALIATVFGAKYYGINGVVAAGLSFSTIYLLWMSVIVRRSWGTRILCELSSRPE